MRNIIRQMNDYRKSILNYNSGYSLYKKGKYREALPYFQEALECRPDNKKVLELFLSCNLNVPFKTRVDDFWRWFSENEHKIVMGDNTSAFTDENVRLLSEGLNLLGPGISFSISRNCEFFFSIDGRYTLFYLFPYVVSQIPEKFKRKWRFYPNNIGSDTPLKLEMHGKTVDMSDVKVRTTYDEHSGCFDIEYYEPQLSILTLDESNSAYQIMMENMLGEAVCFVHIRKIIRIDEQVDGMIPLPKLKTHIKRKLTEQNKPLLNNPQEHFTGYKLEPRQSKELRYDIITGYSCFFGLIDHYYNDSTDLFDDLTYMGAYAAFILFHTVEDDKNRQLEMRRKIEDFIETKILQAYGLGLLSGGASSDKTCYIDLLIFDKKEFLEKITSLLAEYPQYRFYLSDFRQHSNPIPLI